MSAVAASLLLSATCGAQEAAQRAVFSKDEVKQKIADLASPDFKRRQTAVRDLKAAGEVAIDPLREAVVGSGIQQRVLIEQILRELEKSSFESRLRNLAKSPSATAAVGLPEWDRFSTACGSDAQSVIRYVSLLQAEPSLFATAFRTPAELPDLLERRSAELLQTTRPAPVMRTRFSVNAFAGLLLLAGNESTRLPRGTSTAISALLSHPEFEKAVSTEDGSWILRLVGDYILRPRIAVITPLTFARKHPMPEGLTLARNVLKSALRGDNGLYAMMVIHEQGNDKDIALLESLFNNNRPLFAGRKPQSSVTYAVHNGDLALAVAITMRGDDPRDFGFPAVDDRSVPFRFAIETTGFHSDTERRKSRDAYRLKYSATPLGTK